MSPLDEKKNITFGNVPPEQQANQPNEIDSKIKELKEKTNKLLEEVHNIGNHKGAKKLDLKEKDQITSNDASTNSKIEEVIKEKNPQLKQDQSSKKEEEEEETLRLLEENKNLLSELKKLQFQTPIRRESKAGETTCVIQEEKIEASPLMKLQEYVRTFNSTPDPINLMLKLDEFGFENLNSEKLAKLPEPFGSLVNLKELNLKECSWPGCKYKKLTKLPESIGSLVNLKELYLQGNKLTELPESIGSLVNLKVLCLRGNKLTELPESFGSLANLQQLDLSYNQLTKLPENFGLLANLQRLDLSDSNLIKLPESFGSLANLQRLDLSASRNLEKFPESFGSLVNLQTLYLQGPLFFRNYNNNKLRVLPSSIGSLGNLQKLYLSNFFNFTELPLSLGQCENLIEIEITGTQISEQERDTILRQCENLRKKNAPNAFLLRIEAWQNKAQKKFDLSGLKEFNEEKREVLNEWLVRLENTRDFNSKSQGMLCKIVCEMLESVVKEENHEFAESFFSQVQANNECCQDRAAMALNEIYTSWKITQLDQNTSDQEKLGLMVRGAKTVALRDAIRNTIDEQEKKNKSIERESVEIYLYYETSLKEKLNLLTAIDTMAYGAMGNRDWIDEEGLIKKIEETYLDKLIEFPSFDKMVQSNESYNELYEEKIDQMDQNIYNHSDKKPKNVDELSPEYLNWSSEYGGLQENRKKAVAELKKDWVLKNLK